MSNSDKSVQHTDNPNSKRISYRVSLGGIVAALCILMMFLTTVFPVLDMALPLFAGMLISVVAIEISPSWAAVTYAAVSVLSFFVTPDKVASIMFTAFFGYYPIMKIVLDKKKFKLLSWLIKTAVYIAALIVMYELLVKMFGTVDLLEEFGFLKQYMLPVLLIGGVVIFVLYDYTLGLINICYRKWFRPTFLRKFK